MLIWPYVHVTHPRLVARAIKGINLWKKLTRTVIVTTKSSRAGHVYPEIIRACPDMRIIPGLSTGTFLTRFDDVSGWGRIAEEIEECRNYTGGGRFFILDNESSFRLLCNRPGSFSLTGVAMLLAALPHEPTYLWRTGPQMSNPVMRKEVGTALAMASYQQDVRPFTNKWTGPGLDEMQPIRQGHEFMRLLSRDKLVAHICCGARGGRYWDYAEVPDVIDDLPQEVYAATIFPGLRYWESAAGQLAPVLADRFRKPPKR